MRVLGPVKTEAAPVKPAKSAKPVSLEETLDDPVPQFGDDSVPEEFGKAAAE